MSFHVVSFRVMPFHVTCVSRRIIPLSPRVASVRFWPFRSMPFHVSCRFVFLFPVSFHFQEYEKLKADARAQGSGQREEAAALERKLASARSQLDQLGSNKVKGSLAARDAGLPVANSRGRGGGALGGGERAKAGNVFFFAELGVAGFLGSSSVVWRGVSELGADWLRRFCWLWVFRAWHTSDR